MSQQPEGSGRGPVIARAGKRKWGYDVGQVDEFLAHAHELYDSEEPRLTQHDIQNASFDLVKNGYVLAQVDAALARLERAVVDQHTSWELAHGGRVPFKARSEALLAELRPHYERERGRRFREGTGKQPSYDRKQVDRLVDQVIAKASAALGAADDADDRATSELTAARVSNAVFTQRKGRRGYDERCVDYYLDAAVQLLSRIESYARVSEFEHAQGAVDEEAAASHASVAHDAQPQPVAGGSGAAAAPVASLFAAAAAAPVPAPPAPAAPAEQGRATAASRQESFETLNAAEQSIFRPRTQAASAPAPHTAPAPSAAPVASAAPSVAPAAAGFNPAETPGESASSSLAALAHSVEHADVADAASVAPAPSASAPVPAHKPAEDMAATQSFIPWFAQEDAAAPAPAAPSVPVPAPAVEQQAQVPAPDSVVPTPAPTSASASKPEAAPKPEPQPEPSSQPEQDDADRYLSNLLANTSFPKVDLDIPDLSFPSLSGGLDAPKEGDDRNGRTHE